LAKASLSCSETGLSLSPELAVKSWTSDNLPEEAVLLLNKEPEESLRTAFVLIDATGELTIPF